MKFLQKLIKNEENRKNYLVPSVIGIVIAVLITAASLFLVGNFNFNLTTEAGKAFDVNSVWKKDFKAPCTVAGTIDTDTVGTYTCLVKIWGIIPMNVTVDVVDATAPVVMLQGIAVNYGEECEPEDFVSQVVDKSEVIHSFVTMPDTTKIGTQVIQITTTDKYNNSTTQETVLTVKSVIPSYTVEGGSELPPANVFVLDQQLTQVT